MEEEKLDLDLDNNEEIINRKDSRIKSLSDKVKSTSEERDALKAEAEKEKAEREALAKERDFLKGFNTISSKYQGAGEFQDKIWDKVKLGLDVEEATMLVMAKEGKYQAPQPTQERFVAAGGSASTGITDTIQKAPNQMSREDLRSALLEAEQKGDFNFFKS